MIKRVNAKVKNQNKLLNFFNEIIAEVIFLKSSINELKQNKKSKRIKKKINKPVILNEFPATK